MKITISYDIFLRLIDSTNFNVEMSEGVYLTIGTAPVSIRAHTDALTPIRSAAVPATTAPTIQPMSK